MNAPVNAGRFRKLPVTIEAAQYPGVSIAGVDDLMKFEDWINARKGKRRVLYRGAQLIIETLEGDMAANPGDWIICGVAGELYPCAREIFAQTYVRVQG